LSHYKQFALVTNPGKCEGVVSVRVQCFSVMVSSSRSYLTCRECSN